MKQKENKNRSFKIVIIVIAFNLLVYLLFTCIYLALYLENRDANFFQIVYQNNETNLNSVADVFYFGSLVHTSMGTGDIVARSSQAKAAVSIHVMVSTMLNTGLLLYFIRKIV